MLRRYDKKSGVRFSQIAFGTMRFNASDFCNCIKIGTSFLNEIYNSGITTFHSSQEYETFDFFSECLNNLYKDVKKNKIEHIVKIAAPHFKDDSFNSNLLEQRIDNFLIKTGAESIDVVQWLLRHEPNIDYDRLQILTNCRAEFQEKMQSLKKKGKIKSWYSFPYSERFATKVISLEGCSGIIDYLNFLELQDPFVIEMLKNNSQSFIALRPLYAKKVLEMSDSNVNELLSITKSSVLVEAAMKFPLLCSVVKTEVVSIRTKSQLASTNKYAATIIPDDNLFFRIISLLQNKSVKKV
jgi:diketogulonate reductase-like aldo/keto reductase